MTWAELPLAAPPTSRLSGSTTLASDEAARFSMPALEDESRGRQLPSVHLTSVLRTLGRPVSRPPACGHSRDENLTGTAVSSIAGG
jgi:hypothetical protein